MRSGSAAAVGAALMVADSATRLSEHFSSTSSPSDEVELDEELDGDVPCSEWHSGFGNVASNATPDTGSTTSLVGASTAAGTAFSTGGTFCSCSESRSLRMLDHHCFWSLCTSPFAQAYRSPTSLTADETSESFNHARVTGSFVMIRRQPRATVFCSPRCPCKAALFSHPPNTVRPPNAAKASRRSGASCAVLPKTMSIERLSVGVAFCSFMSWTSTCNVPGATAPDGSVNSEL
mmetsp:Transcript_71804/g.166083  ORF Transcript_71804/g.166083 Transcript_71804/m.166083 type:complete len:234 (+) Transcript_71804:278-979(+)